MNPHELPLHALLGVPEMTSPLHQRELPSTAPTTAHGLAGGDARFDVTSILPADDVDIGPTSPVFAELSIEWADHAPHIVLLPADDVVWIGLGEPTIVEDHVRFDLRAGRFVVRLRQGDSTMVVEGAGRVVSVYADPGLIRRSASPTLPVQAWLSADAPDWLQRAVAEKVGAGSLAGAICAAGLVVRFAPYRVRPSGAALRALVLSGEPPDALRDARVALASLAASALDTVERTAATRASALLDQGDTTELRLERDDLESTWVALRLVGRGAALREVLDSVDPLAAGFAPTSPDANDRLLAARREDRGAWWAR